MLYVDFGMHIQLSEHFTFGKLLKFTFPSILMMIFTSIYTVVDGIFVSNFVGKTSFAAVNLVMPILMLCAAFGFMIGSGGSALVAKFLGEGKKEKANETFSLLIYFSIIIGILLATLAFVFMDKIVALLKADGQLAKDAVFYARIVVICGPIYILQNLFQSFLIVAERPKMGLALTIAAGLTNMILDAVFVGILRWGLMGAALATCIAQLIGGIIPLVYFIISKKSTIRLGKFVWSSYSIFKTCTNGLSELVTNIAMSLVSILYNFQLIKIAGEDGIASFGALMYVSYIFVSLFLGYGIGSAPIISYHYGAENTSELKNLFKKDIAIISISGIAIFVLSEVLTIPLAKIFASYDETLFQMIKRAFRLYSFAYLLCGFNIIGSSFFTALNNGIVSAVISFLRTLVFEVAAIFILPIFLKLDGIWLSGVAAEIFSFTVTLICILALRKKYGYF